MAPFFLPMRAGSRFCVMHKPVRQADIQGAVLFVHPFAEEMNKCRRMAALQARAFADAGCVVLQIDLYGCGDSAGDFGDASWQRWVEDVVTAHAWLCKESGQVPLLWGLRAGCLLAAQAAQQVDSAPDLVLWQPALSGKQLLQQFLRLGVASQMLAQAGAERGTTAQLRELLTQGQSVEIGGYLLSPSLALGLEVAELTPPRDCARIAWFEISSSGAELSPAASKRIRALQDRGHHVDARVINGSAFWLTVEASECITLIQETVAVVSAWQGERLLTTR